MMSTPEEIEAAVANYRKIIAERNKRDLKVFINAIVNAEFEDEEVAAEFTEEEMHKERMDQLSELVNGDLDDLAQPTELLDRFDELAPKLRLDGTLGGHLDPELRATLADDYFKALDAALREKALDEVKDTISAPEELRILARHVLGIVGSGLPHEQTMVDMSFWKDNPPFRITAPDKTHAALAFDDDDRIALGWVTGSDGDYFWTAVYVQESDDAWVWKYVWIDPTQLKVFDTIPELLEWFLYYSDEDAPLLEGVTAEDVIDRAVFSLAVPQYLE